MKEINIGENPIGEIGAKMIMQVEQSCHMMVVVYDVLMTCMTICGLCHAVSILYIVFKHVLYAMLMC